MAQSPEYPDLRWIPPRSYTPGRVSGYPPRFICVHYTAGSERSTSAEDGALYDQRRTDGTSSHYYVDSDSVIQCVRTTDRSHTALYHGNRDAIHYELCGTVQTRAQWLDAASRPTLRNAAAQMVRDMQKYRIPLSRVIGRAVRPDSATGVCGHVDFTNGWPEDGGTHTDPGPEFPWDVLFDDIRAALEGDVELSDSMVEYQGYGNVGGTLATTLGYSRDARAQTAGLEAKIDQLLAAAGEEVQRDADEAARDAELLAAVQAVQAGDPQALADLLGPMLTVDLLDALRARLES